MDTVFFVFSKFVGAFLRPDTWIIVILAGIVWALMHHRNRLALWFSSTLLVVLLTLAIFPLGNPMLQPIERQYSASPHLSGVDGIIVLGGGEDLQASTYWGQLQFNEGGDRFAAGLSLARRFPDAPLLFAGGSGTLRDVAGAEVSEASIAGQFFLDHGISRDRLLLEGRSRNTAENARFSMALAAPKDDETWVLVTSAFHMPRAMQSFEAAGWPALVAWPVDYRTARFSDQIGWDLTRNMLNLQTAIRENVGQVAYRLSGR